MSVKPDTDEHMVAIGFLTHGEQGGIVIVPEMARILRTSLVRARITLDRFAERGHLEPAGREGYLLTGKGRRYIAERELI